MLKLHLIEFVYVNTRWRSSEELISLDCFYIIIVNETVRPRVENPLIFSALTTASKDVCLRTHTRNESPHHPPL